VVEHVRIGYGRLFEVRVLHHYWLDEGATVFDSIADEATRNERLVSYDVRRLVAIEPSRATARAIAGLRGVLRTTGLGFVVAVPATVLLTDDVTFEFFMTVVAPAYGNYTALTLRPQRTVDVTDPADHNVVRRYKANVPVLSNLTGASRGTGPSKRLFLSQEYIAGADSGDAVEALVTSGNNLRQLTGDPPNPPFHVLGLRSAHPVYVHQGDVPPITPPAGSTGAPAAGVELTDESPPDVAALIRIASRRPDDAAFSVVDAAGRPRTRVFEVHLRNRWTTWRYHDKGTGAVASTEPDPLPLTYFGNTGSKRKPSTAAIAVELDGDNPTKVTRLISDVYV
jgi:hypothetical protein